MVSDAPRDTELGHRHLHLALAAQAWPGCLIVTIELVFDQEQQLLTQIMAEALQSSILFLFDCLSWAKTFSRRRSSGFEPTGLAL